MIIRATNGDKVNLLPTDRFLLTIHTKQNTYINHPKNMILTINCPIKSILFGIHSSQNRSELIWLSDNLGSAFLAQREYFDAEEELKKFRQNDPESITTTNAYRIFQLAKELRHSECGEEEIYELTDEIIRLTSICPQCDGGGEIPEPEGMVDCNQCGGKGFILPRPSLEDEFGEMPF
jgi:hypothetical protein